MSDISAIDKYLEKGREEMQDAFDEAVKPIHEWLLKYGHPHMKVIVDQAGAEAVEGVCGLPLDPPD